MDRPETEEMLRDVRDGVITGLIFSKLARLARNTQELLEFSKLFQSYEADLISLQESIDTSTPAGRFFFTIVAGMAQWEREEISDRISASVPIRAKLGKPLGGTGTFGYRWNEGKLEPHPDEAPVRRRIYELFAKEKRLKAVARILNDAGHRTKRGAKFTDTTIRRLIEDPTAKGLRRANYTRSMGEGKGWELKPEKDWVLIPVEPIVSEELWDECNHFLAERARGRKPAKKRKHLFSGFVWCKCGQRMYVPSNTPKYVCRGCRNKITVRDLEAVFVHELKSLFLSEEQVATYLDQGNQAQGKKEELLQALNREHTRLNKESDKLYQLYQGDQLSPEGFGKRHRPLEERLEQLDMEIPRLQGEIDFLRISNLSSVEIIAGARELYSRWEDQSEENKRTVVENIVRRITIGKKDVKFALEYMPPIPPAPLPKTVVNRQQTHVLVAEAPATMLAPAASSRSPATGAASPVPCSTVSISSSPSNAPACASSSTLTPGSRLPRYASA